MKTKGHGQAGTLYLVIVLGVCYLLGLIEFITGSGKFYQILAIAFTFIPVTAAAVTKRMTGEKAAYHLSLCVWKNMKCWLLSAFVPGILIAVGAVLYYLIFPGQYSGTFKIGTALGTGTEIIVSHPLTLAAGCIVISALMIPIQLLELGEEIGWRGYLLGFQVRKYGTRRAVLINGIEWGFAHLPLVYFGFNYSTENPGAPWSNMGMMMITCLVLGTILSYVTIKSSNCMYAAIIHGVVNVIGELPVYLSTDLKSGLLGPNPSGLITMLPLMIPAVLCFLFFREKQDSANKST